MKTIREDIKNMDFKPVYLLYGEEAYLRQQYRDDLLKALVADGDTMNYSRYEGKDVKIRELIDLCETMPFLAERRVILLEDTGFFKNKCEELADYMKSLPDYLHLVFVEEQVDKRSRMYKLAKELGRAVEFEPLKEEKLIQWTAGFLGKNGRNISQRDAERLLSMTGTDMGNLRNELEKLVAYTEGRSAVTARDMEAVCVTRMENRIFDMVRAVTEKNQKKALALYDDLLALKEPPMRILFLLTRQFRQLLLTKKLESSGMSQREVIAKLGIPAFAYRNVSACARSYTIGELENAQQDFVEAEEAVKTGRLSDRLSVELLIVKWSA